jgi:hypothetical protein
MTRVRGARPAPYAGPVTPHEPHPEHPHPALGTAAPVEPIAVPTRLLVAVGTGLWALALVVTLVVPSLHTGNRSWWPWTCVSGIALGAIAWWYVGRGHDNAANA